MTFAAAADEDLHLTPPTAKPLWKATPLKSPAAAEDDDDDGVERAKRDDDGPGTHPPLAPPPLRIGPVAVPHAVVVVRFRRTASLAVLATDPAAVVVDIALL